MRSFSIRQANNYRNQLYEAKQKEAAQSKEPALDIDTYLELNHDDADDLDIDLSTNIVDSEEGKEAGKETEGDWEDVENEEDVE